MSLCVWEGGGVHVGVWGCACGDVGVCMWGVWACVRVCGKVCGIV